MIVNDQERMLKICDFYGYEFCQNDEGRIVICNSENRYEYDSVELMLKDWKDICKITNDDYIENGLKKPFSWII